MTSSRKHIVFVHLLNDYSGSPLILSQVIRSMPGKDIEKTLFTSRSGRDGFLSHLPGVHTRYFWYRWQANAWMRLIAFTASQCLLFFQLLRYWRKDVTIYVNTLLPFGAALAGKLMGKKVIYHIHETSMKPLLLKRFLRAVANNTASQAIFVSNYLAAHERLSGPVNIVMYNKLSELFMQEAAAYRRQPASNEPFVVLMVCSLKEYKGVNEFVSLAARLPELSFELVLNAPAQEVKAWFGSQTLPANLVLHDAQKNVHPFYQKASLLLNLSHPDKWIETFGMTVLEGMYYHIPAIVPPVGGVAELVTDGENGFYADSRNLPQLADCIRTLYTDKILYRRFSEAAYQRALAFTTKINYQ